MSHIDITTDDVPDAIVRSVTIRASIRTVWELVSEPGWFVNDGEYVPHEIHTEGTRSRVVDPTHGEFWIEALEIEEPYRAVFRWRGGEAGPLDEFPTNDITFTLAEVEGGVLLTVRETGFAGIAADEATRRRRFEDNAQGWDTELEIARSVSEGRDG